MRMRARLVTTASMFVLLAGSAVGFAACGGDDSNGGGTPGGDAGTTPDSSVGADTGTDDGGDHGLGDSSTSDGGRDRDGGDAGAADGAYMGACTTATPDTQGSCQDPSNVCHLYKGRGATYCTVPCPDGGGCPLPSPKCGGDRFCAVP